MYKIKIWDTEDKLDFAAYNNLKYGSSFSDDKKEDIKYNEQKYGSDDKGSSSDYMKKQDAEENKDEKKLSELEAMDDGKKPASIGNKEEDIPVRAAKQLFNQQRFEERKKEMKKEISTIEEAIKKAIETEKKVIVLDN